MIRTNHISFCETPPDAELEYLSSIFERSYIEYDPRSFKRFTIRKKNGDKAEFYQHFVNLHKLFQTIPELDHKTFVKAQFHYNNCPINPWQLLNRLSLVRYYNYLDLDTSRQKMEKDWEFVITSNHTCIWEFCKENKVEPSLAGFLSHTDRNGNLSLTFEREYNGVPHDMVLCNSRTYNGIKDRLGVFKVFPGVKEFEEVKKTYLLYPRLIQVFKEKFGETESML